MDHKKSSKEKFSAESALLLQHCSDLQLLAIDIQIYILQFVPPHDKYHLTRYTCRRWYYLMQWYDRVPNEKVLFLFPGQFDHVVKSPFYNAKYDRTDHSMKLAALGLGVYINGKFCWLVNRAPSSDAVTKATSLDRHQCLANNANKNRQNIHSNKKNSATVHLQKDSVDDWFEKFHNKKLRSNTSVIHKESFGGSEFQMDLKEKEEESSTEALSVSSMEASSHGGAEENDNRLTDEDDILFGEAGSVSEENLKAYELEKNKKNLEGKDMKNICQALAANDCITLIDLSHCNLGNYEIRLLCAGLVQNHSVTDVMLVGNDIGVLGCEYLGYMLEFNDSLRSLWLRGNTLIGNEGLKYIAKGLQYNCTLQKLSLDDCDIRSETLRKDTYKQYGLRNDSKNSQGIPKLLFVKLLPVTASARFDALTDYEWMVLKEKQSKNQQAQQKNWKLSSSHYNNSGEEEHCDYVLEDKLCDGIIALAHVLCGNGEKDNLQIISLRNNQITDDMACVLIDGVNENGSLKEFHLSYNQLTNTSARYLTEMMNNSSKSDGSLDVYIKSGNQLDENIFACNHQEQIAPDNPFQSSLRRQFPKGQIY
ncbi:leucine rich repeat containing 34 [Reticulomyxa filosa]|uniref:Leucine rich repeat containing 34 n=1 Tax=Reticulomyxa filosa TaxID=46433 RepID=X6MPC8_RETFI|nr:leucine rich repeat containing 34 [Reticulomyxa filosa]|eukprot:ETO15714.1 leucine rich repeat containing 34 [Reticulomyxa filosa]